MPVKQSLTSVIVIGPWNAAIISPQWLAQHKVVEEVPDDMSYELGVPVNRLSFAIGDVSWAVDGSRLEVKASKFKDCGCYVARIMALLPHTPVGAIGTNFVFTSPIPDWPPSKLPRLGDLQLTATPVYPDMHQVQWIGLRTLADGTNLQITVIQQEQKEVAAAFNFHRNVPNAETAKAYALAWSLDRDVAVQLMKEMFGIERYDQPPV